MPPWEWIVGYFIGVFIIVTIIRLFNLVKEEEMYQFIAPIMFYPVCIMFGLVVGAIALFFYVPIIFYKTINSCVIKARSLISIKPTQIKAQEEFMDSLEDRFKELGIQ